MNCECYVCNQEFEKALTCTCKNLVFFDGHLDIKLERIPWSGDIDCGDCGVTKGGYHHPGCDMEDCPKCGGQLISCGCKYEY